MFEDNKVQQKKDLLTCWAHDPVGVSTQQSCSELSLNLPVPTQVDTFNKLCLCQYVLS